MSWSTEFGIIASAVAFGALGTCLAALLFSLVAPEPARAPQNVRSGGCAFVLMLGLVAGTFGAWLAAWLCGV